MRIELIPLVAGVLVALLGFVLLFDAATTDEPPSHRDLRRSVRLERSRGGEATVGLGVLGMAAALIGRDFWSYSVIAAGAGAILLVLGTLANWSYLRHAIRNRGALRRRTEEDRSQGH